MRARVRWLSSLAVAGLAVIGCSGGGHSPTTPAGSASLAPSGDHQNPVYTINPEGDSLQGIYHLTIDPVTLSAGSELIPGRANAAQGQLVDIDVENFLKGDSFTVTGVVKDVSGNVVLDFQFKHPFPKPNLALPSNPGTNRADLSATGRLVILADSNLVSYFGGTVDVDPSLVVNPDGFVDPGDLLVSASTTADAYPYVLLADEAKDNRTDSVDGSPIATGGAGDYNAGAGGWQASNIGGGAGWTGHDFIHAGHTVSNSITLSGTALAASAWTVDVALLMKYNNPKRTGGPTTAFRLPPATANVIDFAYRLPFAALDASVSSFPEITIPTAAASSSDPIAGLLRDWDAAASEAADDNLADETDVSLIQPGAAGAPVAEVSAPFLSATDATLTAGVGQSGEAGDEIGYSGVLTNSLGTAPVGRQYALVRFTDPEAALSDDAYHFGVDGVTTVPDPARAIAPITYQVLAVDVGGGLVAPDITAVGPLLVCPGDLVTFTPTNIGGAVDTWAWDFAPITGATPTTSTNPSPQITMPSTPGIYTGCSVTATNGAGMDTFLFDVEIQEQWPHYTADAPLAADWGLRTYGFWADMTMYNNRPVIVHNVPVLDASPNPTASISIELRLSFANVDVPTSPSDWTSYVVLTYPTTGTSITSNVGARLAKSNGRLLVAYKPQTLTAVWVTVAQVTEPAVPTQAQWSAPYQAGQQLASNFISAAGHNGGFVLGYRGFVSNPMQLSVASSNNPAAIGDWSTVLAEDATASLAFYSGIYSYDDGINGPRLQVMYRDTTTGLLRIAQQNTANPPVSLGFTPYVLDAGGANAAMHPRMKEFTVGGQKRLVVVHSQQVAPAACRVITSNTVTPTSIADWNTPVTLWTSTGMTTSIYEDVTVVGGRLFVVGTVLGASATPLSPSLRGARALVENPLTITDWQVGTINNDQETINAVLQGVNGLYANVVTLADGSPLVAARYGANYVNDSPFGAEVFLLDPACPLP